MTPPRKVKTDNDSKNASSRAALKSISVRGARAHNLRNVDLSVPRDELVVFTGVSGSGKSSLVFDTIYAEGQRRYVESLSAYARQFLEMTQKPDVDHIEGLSPAISIEQKTTSRNPRSTVGTVTEIYDYMRLLWARAGIPYSPATGLPIESQTITQMVETLEAFPEGARFLLLAPIARGRKGNYKKDLAELFRQGFQRVKIDGSLYDLGEEVSLDKNVKHDVEVVVDRIVIRKGDAARLTESLETCLTLADGLAFAERVDGSQERLTFSSSFACPVSGFTLTEIEPRLFSFNNPFGACPECDGIGVRLRADENLVIPFPERALSEGAIAPWGRYATIYPQVLESLGAHYGFVLKTPWQDLPEDVQNVLLYGSKGLAIPMAFTGSRGKKKSYLKPFEGVIPNLERRYQETDSEQTREDLRLYMSETICNVCNGARLKPEALVVKIAKQRISDVTRLSVKDAFLWFQELPKALSEKQRQIADRVLKEIVSRLRFLIDVGLSYISLERSSRTLSGGESQRIRLASQIGSGLTGVIYVLDEPSIGLHQRDNERLIKTLARLRDLGNSVLVVEHDEDAIRSADYIVDVGPGAGINGGLIVAKGDLAAICAVPESLTGQYLSGARAIHVPKTRRPFKNGGLRLTGASGNNLKNVSVEIPQGLLTCVIGVSGGGKSTLIIETLCRAIARSMNRAQEKPAPFEALEGLSLFDKIVNIDQSAIGRTPRSNPATYTGAFTPIREWFASLPESRQRGYSAGRFSFNVKGGRCEACQGDGVIKVEMHFLPDVYVTCEACRGRRYEKETLEVKFKEKSIADVLEMSLEEAVTLFKAVPAIRSRFMALIEVGLGYMKVGQAATTLSGGEAQRVKLAKELAKRATGRTLYILDEPTTGLHFHDVAKLVDILQKLTDQGNTVIVIEHNLDVVKTADWLIEMGPEGGENGGYVTAVGTPEDLAALPDSCTGVFLKRLLDDAGR